MVRRNRGRTVLLCPSCGSPKITLIAGSILGQVYRCGQCDYVGSLVLEADVPEEDGASSDS